MPDANNDPVVDSNWWNAPAVDPYRGFRWKITFAALAMPEMYAMKCDKPSYKVGEYVHKILNHQFNYPGRVVWEPITMTVVEVPKGPAHVLAAALLAAGYPTPVGGHSSAGQDGLSKAAATGQLGQVTITQLKANATSTYSADAATHEEGAEYTLVNAWIQDVKFGSLDYSSEDAVTIDFTIRYDFASLAEDKDSP